MASGGGGGGGGKMIKLKLNTSGIAQSPPPASAASAVESTPTTAKIKLTNKFAATPTSAKPKGKADAAKPASATTKKRGRDVVDDSQGSAKKKRASAASKIKLQTQGPKLIRFKSGGLNSPATPISATKLKIKSKGKPMHRPLGVGYDSEAEEAEEDPSFEENFILRMAPGPDCEYLRKAIEDRKIGVPVSQGGADVHMRFFTRDGRRAAITIQGRSYAAALVDLPCIIESMKSWDKKGFWKSADICQMLLVLGRVSKEDDAKDYKLPREIDHKTWQYPHGITPPMFNARKRRFRKRVSHRTIEAAEAEVERQLALDDQAYGQKGEVILEDLDVDDLNREEEDDGEGEEDEEEEDDAEGEMDDMFGQEDDQDALLAELEGQLADDDQPMESVVPSTTPAAGSSEAPTPAADNTPADAMRSSSAGAQVSASGEDDMGDEEEDEEEDDEDDDDDDDDQDDGARERAAELAEKRAAIRDLEKQLQETIMQKQKMTNPVFKARFDSRIKALEQDLHVKKRDIGEDDDDD